MRVGLYARVSTVDKQDPAGQLGPLQEFAKARGWEIVGSFTDRASAVNMKQRTEWRKLMALAAKRRIRAIVCWKLDRCFRSTLHLSTTLEELRSYGVTLYSVTEPWVATDERNPMSDLIRTVLGAVAEFERSLIAERVRMGLDRARQQGRRLGRPAKVNGNLDELRPLIASGALSMSAAARRLGVNPSTVSRALRKPHAPARSEILVNPEFSATH